MQKTIQKMLLMSLIILCSATAILSQATEANAFVRDSVTIPPAQSIAKPTNVDDCNAQLLTVLNALDKAENAIKFLQAEIEARKNLENINKELLAVKDLIITEQSRLITLLQGEKKESKFQKAIKTIIKFGERILLLYVGVQIGKGL